MKDNYTHISIVLDSSSSMYSYADATREGLNSFIDEQKKLGKEATVSLVQFNSTVREQYSFQNLQKVPRLNQDNYIPSGMTALLDAIGYTINTTGEKLAALPEELRPNKVLIVIQTDGQENNSGKFDRQQIFDMITHQKEKYLWDFLFLGANQDAIAIAADYGINSKSSLTYDMGNTRKAFATASKYANDTLRARSAVEASNLAFSDQDRQEAVDVKTTSV
jgi:uncharacterized protein YegL